MDFIRRFMLVVGPVSSVFDFLTFCVLLHVFHAGEALFHTGWFVESLATQVLVIFVIRTPGGTRCAAARARWLVVTSLAVVACAWRCRSRRSRRCSGSCRCRRASGRDRGLVLVYLVCGKSREHASTGRTAMPGWRRAPRRAVRYGAG